MVNGRVNDCGYEMWVVMMGRDGIRKRHEKILHLARGTHLQNLSECCLLGSGPIYSSEDGSHQLSLTQNRTTQRPRL